MAEPIFQPPPNYREEPPFKYLSTLKAGEMWIQSLNKDGIRAPAKEENRIFLNPTSSKDAELSLCYAAVSIMERDLGGHADRFDPFQIAVFYAPLGELKFVCGGTVHVGEGGHHIDENDEPCDAFGYVNFKFPTTRLGVGFPVPNLFPKTPLTVSTPFEWSTINDNQFERLIFAMYDDDANFKNVEWLQHVNAPDAGRDISATRAENDSRILIQARHVKKSISEVDANEVVTKAETWDPPFDEIIISTTATFTQNAIRWKEQINKNRTRPSVGYEPHSRLEVKLSRRPHLIAHLGLRL